MKNVTGVAVVGLASALAVTGWVHGLQPAQTARAGYSAASVSAVDEQPFLAQPAVNYSTAGTPQFQTVGERRYSRSYRDSGYNDYDRYRGNRNSSTYEDHYNDRNSGRYSDRYNGRYNNGRYNDRGYRDDRSLGHSAAIVGGSAAAGAAVGGLAKGGKGAAVGALAGGAAGLIYDRATHEHARW